MYNKIQQNMDYSKFGYSNTENGINIYIKLHSGIHIAGIT